MIRKKYFVVRQLIREGKNAVAEKIFVKLQLNVKDFSDEENYWYIRIQIEIEIRKGNLDFSEVLLTEAFSLSEKLDLSSAELSSINGKIGTVKCRNQKHEEAIPFLRKALIYTNDPPRRNYYHSRLLHCLFHLKDKEIFVKTLNITLNEILQSDILGNLNSIMNTIWEYSQYAKQRIWYQIIGNVLEEFQYPPDSFFLKKAIIELIWARLVKQRLNLEEFLIHMKEGLDVSRKVNPAFFVSMSLEYIAMLENPFSENHRAVDLLEECLKVETKVGRRKIQILNKLGSNYRFIGDYNQAIHCLEEAIELNREIKSDWLESFSHNTLGMIYTVFGDGKSLQKAQNHYKSSLDINKRINDPYGQGYTYGAIGWLKSNQGNLDEAKKYYELSISVFESKTNNIPPIILLALGELLSRINNRNIDQVDKLIKQAQIQIWETKRRIDIGRYYNTMGSVALNRGELAQAENEFSKALDYGDYFEVETQTLLGLAKVNFELFTSSDNRNYLDKARLILNDLKEATNSSFLIFGEVDLILGLIAMYTRNYSIAKDKFNQVIELAQKNNYLLLESKGIKQKETLEILTRHQKLEKIASSSMKNDMKINHIKEAIDYLNELSRFLGPRISKKNGR